VPDLAGFLRIAGDLQIKYVAPQHRKLTIGMTVVFTKTITEADIVLFSGPSGYKNPIHVNDTYAKGTRF
jgi:acyl dehydratase